MAVRILDWYPEFENWMRLFLRSTNGTVYVHCKAGINRSAFLVLTFVSKNFGIDFRTLLSAVRKQRPIICDNSAFMKQVEDELYGRVQSEEDTGNGNNVNGNA
jgi:protein-tyrosine phosphatase